MAGGTSLDWSLVQAFLAVSEVGSLSAAARVLGSSQPTVGRQIHTMEEQLGAELFQRHDKGLTLTATGEAMLPPARAMRQAIHEIELRAAGKAETLEGAVRITSSVVVGTEHLPPIIARIRREEPRIELELHVSDETSNLHFREADIAVRMYRPTQLDLVTQHLGDLRFAAFAAKSYLERRGLPRRPEELLAHDVIGMDRETAILEGFRQAGFPVERGWFKVRADNPTAYWQLVRAGAGIGFGQVLIGARDPELVEIPLGLELPTYPVWLTAHEAIRHAPRVARVWELLAHDLREVLSR
ncbi:MAG TPA: LysR family transcriptional regulator [Polyangiaceae bacterium]|nr:LysR family transcriptional regulator [Polyangiaceae bacterium]